MNAPNKKEKFDLSLPFKDTGGEKLLQYIWQFQYFNKSSLQTTSGEELQIIFLGKLNHDQGPDFLNAQIKIGNTILAGSVELHLKTSQWNEHGHHDDANYKNVIMHVVFENNLDNFHLPVLELQPRISSVLIDRYASLMNGEKFIPCANSISEVKDITWLSWKERLLAERLTRKSKIVFGFLQQNNNHWEESFWWMLARNFGIKVNADAFEEMARSIPANILAKHKSQIHQIEALLFGQVNLVVGDFTDAYPKLLQREYLFLKKKYSLNPIHQPVHFLRMRPGNFPSIRLAQLAVLIQNSAHLFSKLLEAEKVSEIKNLFNITANDYWHYHYLFDEASSFKKKNIGKNMVDNIIINTIVPMLFAYGLYHKDDKHKLKAIQWLEETAAETNTITKGFGELNAGSKNAFDSQSLIELKTRYCDERQCLSCSVGNAILRTT